MILYHVTHTKNVDSIRKRGLRRFQPSNWIKAGDGKRYGNGEVYAFEHESDAVRWAGRMDWEFHKATGTGKISIIAIVPEQEWTVDESDPLSQAGSRGRWVKSNKPVMPRQIDGSYPVTLEVIRNAVKELHET